VTTSSSSFSQSSSFFIIWIFMTSFVLFSSSSWVFKVMIYSSCLLSRWLNSALILFKSWYISLRWLVKIFSLFSTSFLCATISASKNWFSSNWFLHAFPIPVAYSNWTFKFVIIYWTYLELVFWDPFFISINYSLSDLFFIFYFIRSSNELINYSSKSTMPSSQSSSSKSIWHDECISYHSTSTYSLLWL